MKHTKLIATLVFFSCFCLSQVLANNKLLDEIKLLRSEIDRVRGFVPKFPLTDPAPFEIEELLASSQEKAQEALTKAKSFFVTELDFRLKLNVYKIGSTIKAEKTSSCNYRRRKSLLLELEEHIRATRRAALVTVFRRGLPSSNLTLVIDDIGVTYSPEEREEALELRYSYCDKTFVYLSFIYEKEVKRLLAKRNAVCEDSNHGFDLNHRSPSRRITAQRNVSRKLLKRVDENSIPWKHISKLAIMMGLTLAMVFGAIQAAQVYKQ